MTIPNFLSLLSLFSYFLNSKRIFLYCKEFSPILYSSILFSSYHTASSIGAFLSFFLCSRPTIGAINSSPGFLEHQTLKRSFYVHGSSSEPSVPMITISMDRLIISSNNRFKTSFVASYKINITEKIPNTVVTILVSMEDGWSYQFLSNTRTKANPCRTEIY